MIFMHYFLLPARLVLTQDHDLMSLSTLILQVKNTGDKSPPILVSVCVNNVQVDMEFDTGAPHTSLSLASPATEQRLELQQGSYIGIV